MVHMYKTAKILTIFFFKVETTYSARVAPVIKAGGASPWVSLICVYDDSLAATLLELCLVNFFGNENFRLNSVG
jgi:hypothetical protein